MKFLVIQFSPLSCHLILLRSKSSSAFRSQTPSVYVLPLMSEIKFRTNTEPQAKL
jgi:hypothetical protein